MTDERVVERAHAKLNVFLRVLGRRDDGHHGVETLILPVDLYDVVTVEAAERLEVEVTGPRADELEGSGGESLVSRAVHELERATGLSLPVRITVEKRIPVAAGLGGGSADAAATLRAIGRLVPEAASALPDVAAAVGADVPALLHGGPVFADGRGDRVVPVHALTTQWVVRPFGFGVRAADAYSWWDETMATGPDPGALIAAMETGNVDLLGDAMFNDLQAGVVQRHPPVARAIDELVDGGATGAIVSGSGPTVVALLPSPGKADLLAASIRGSIATSGPPVR